MNGANGAVATEWPALRILTANDIYGPERFAMLHNLCQGLKDDAGTTKFVLPGDLLGGSLFANLHQGESVIDLLNAIEVDYCVLGNHEFDYGAERTKALMSLSRFPWLGSNVRTAESSRPIFHNTMDLDSFSVQVFGSTRSVTVGVFGLCTAATPQLSQPGKEVVFEQPLEHAKRCVKLLKDQGCAFIVALTHLSLVNDKELAEKCEGINVILGGHDHDPFFLVHRGVLIAKCGQNADHLGILDLHMDFTGPGNSLQVDHSFQFLTTSKAHPDPKVSEIAQKWSAKGQEGADETICHVIDVELSSRTNELRTRENSFGSLVADAMHWQFSSEGCEGAIINGGFVRQDRSYPPGSALTRAMINEEMPFNKSIALQKLTGHQLRKGLEEMLAPTPTPVACFPQLSHSLRLRYAPHAPAMQKIQSLQINGAEVDPQRDYLIAVSEFYTLVAADGVKTFHEADVVQMHEGLIRDSVANYLHTKKEISGERQGRCQAI